MAKVLSDLDLGGTSRIRNSLDPISSQDLMTKNYGDSTFSKLTLTEQVDSTTTDGVFPAPTTDILRVTNALLSNVFSIGAPVPAKNLIVINGKTTSLVVNNGIAANGIRVPNSDFLTIPPGASILLTRSASAGGWIVVGNQGLFVAANANTTFSGNNFHTGFNEFSNGVEFTQLPPTFYQGLAFANPDFSLLQFRVKPEMTGEIFWYMPTAQGAANTYLKNDGAGNLSWSTVAGGSGSTNKTSAEVNFGTNSDYVKATVSATWIASSSILALSITPSLLDHDPEDVLLEELKCTYANIVVGVSVDVHVHAPNGTHGRYNINIIGV